MLFLQHIPCLNSLQDDFNKWLNIEFGEEITILELKICIIHILSGALLYFICWFLFQWLPESARFDMTRGNRPRALATLERIAKENGKPMPLGKLIEPTFKFCAIFVMSLYYLSLIDCFSHILMYKSLLSQNNGTPFSIML